MTSVTKCHTEVCGSAGGGGYEEVVLLEHVAEARDADGLGDEVVDAGVVGDGDVALVRVGARADDERGVALDQ